MYPAADEFATSSLARNRIRQPSPRRNLDLGELRRQSRRFRFGLRVKQGSASATWTDAGTRGDESLTHFESLEGFAQTGDEVRQRTAVGLEGDIHDVVVACTEVSYQHRRRRRGELIGRPRICTWQEPLSRSRLAQVVLMQHKPSLLPTPSRRSIPHHDESDRFPTPPLTPLPHDGALVHFFLARKEGQIHRVGFPSPGRLRGTLAPFGGGAEERTRAGGVRVGCAEEGGGRSREGFVQTRRGRMRMWMIPTASSYFAIRVARLGRETSQLEVLVRSRELRDRRRRREDDARR